MKFTEIIHLLNQSARKGAVNALGDFDKDQCLSKAQAYRIYGRSTVDRWIQEQLLRPVQPSGKSNKIFDRNQLELIANSSNRITYLPVAERSGTQCAK